MPLECVKIYDIIKLWVRIFGSCGKEWQKLKQMPGRVVDVFMPFWSPSHASFLLSPLLPFFLLSLPSSILLHLSTFLLIYLLFFFRFLFFFNDSVLLNSFCVQGWLCTQDPPASTFRMLRLEVCTAMPHIMSPNNHDAMVLLREI